MDTIIFKVELNSVDPNLKTDSLNTPLKIFFTSNRDNLIIFFSFK